MSSLVVLDTSIFIDYLRRRQHQERLDSLSGIMRTSSVVLSELWRGARKSQERKFLLQLESNHPVFAPTQRNWTESGQILAEIAADRGFTAGKLRDLHFDLLIALSTRSHGARLVTSNRTDFEWIQKYRPFVLETW